MSINLSESVKLLLTGDMANKIAAQMGESYVNVQQAIQGGVPCILTGILIKAESGDIRETMNLATDAARVDIPFNLNSLNGNSGNSKGMDFLKNIFGERTNNLTEAIANYAGISSQSASSLLSLMAPASLGVLGKHILESNMNESGLRSFLNAQKKKILNVMPVGLFLDGLLGHASIMDVTEKFSGEKQNIRHSGKRFRWLIPVIVVAAVAGAIYYFIINQKPAENVSQPLIVDTAVPAKEILTPPKPLIKQNSVKLPDGSVLNAKKGSLEDQLVNFLSDPGSKPSRRFPYNFDQLNFNTGTAVITPESMKQVQNVALILKAFPKVKIKIGGFSQRGGDSLLSSNLSESRAISVASALKTSGANADQVLGGEGFGSDFAKYYAEAPDSLKEKDNHISISVRSK